MPRHTPKERERRKKAPRKTPTERRKVQKDKRRIRRRRTGSL